MNEWSNTDNNSDNESTVSTMNEEHIIDESDILQRSPDTTTVFFTFGRFNPPTVGHLDMIKRLVHAAKQEGGPVDIYVFPSSKQNSNNPLSIKLKVIRLREILQTDNITKDTDGTRIVKIINTTTCGSTAYSVIKSCKSPYQVIPALKQVGYKRIVFGVGNDRFEGPDAFTGMDKMGVQLIELGEKGKKRNTKKSISASRMRYAVMKHKVNRFMRGTRIKNRTVAKKIMSIIKRKVINKTAKTTKKAKHVTRKSKSKNNNLKKPSP
jgi:nicotinic acid mononucleotide adenylyltransferase